MRREFIGGLVGGVIGALIVLVLSGGPGLTHAREKEIRAKSIVVVDDEGNLRASLSAGGLMLLDEEFKRMASLDETGLAIRDDNSKLTVLLNDFGLEISDGNFNSRASLGMDGLSILDEEGNPVLTGGYSQEDGEAVLAIKRSDGEIIWKARPAASASPWDLCLSITAKASCCERNINTRSTNLYMTFRYPEDPRLTSVSASFSDDKDGWPANGEFDPN